jgi:hypothetical protein
VNIQIALATTKKNQLSVANYNTKMTHYADELVASSAPLRDDEHIAYILTGLEEDYNLVFTATIAQVDQLLSLEQHTHIQARASSAASSSTMTATRSQLSTYFQLLRDYCGTIMKLYTLK